MPRGKRCFPGGAVFHALNRGNGRRTLFSEPADYDAFVRVVKEALFIVPMRILGYCLMPNHWPLPRPVDGLGRVNQALNGAEIDALRRCTKLGRSLRQRAMG